VQKKTHWKKIDTNIANYSPELVNQGKQKPAKNPLFVVLPPMFNQDSFVCFFQIASSAKNTCKLSYH